MKLLGFFKKVEKTEKPGRFSDFFLRAPEKEKEEILREAACKANGEQWEVFMRSQFKAKTG